MPPPFTRPLIRAGIALGALGLVLAAGGPAQAHRPGPSTEIVDTARGSGSVVSFTFDDGPNPADTRRLLSVLHRNRIQAVFCLWGDHVNEHPDLVRRIAAAGHTLCNHGMRHDDMSTWTPEQIRADLRETNAAIRRAVPGAAIPYFRAPYGKLGTDPGRRRPTRHAATGLASRHRRLGDTRHGRAAGAPAGRCHARRGRAHARRRR